MKPIKAVKSIHQAQEVYLGHHKIHQAFPIYSLNDLDPFILLHHFSFDIEAGDTSFYVPPHPHRGFCPITFMFNGSIEHRDSLGNQETIHDYEVQWINAGRGIIHSEQIEKKFAEQGGKYQGIQLWINLAASEKMQPASYQPLHKDQIVVLEGSGSIFRLVSGMYQGLKGPDHSQHLTALLTLEKGTSFNLELSDYEVSALYNLEGSVKVNSKIITEPRQLLVFESLAGTIELVAQEKTQLLVLAGTPINEPVVQHGPFVMNTQTEVLEAMRDYQQGKMGFLY